MTLMELAREYRAEENALRERIAALEGALRATEDAQQQKSLESRLHILHIMRRETRDVAVLMEHYYERGYRRNGRYIL